MFGFGKVFRGRSYYVFDYKPRYYDERKERIEKIKEKYAESNENLVSSDDEIKPIKFSKNDLRKSWEKNKTGGSDRSVTIRLALIITLIVGIIAYIFDFHSIL